MKVQTIFLLFTLSAIVRGWVASLSPILLSIGTALLALMPDPIIEPFVDIPPPGMPDWIKDKKKKKKKGWDDDWERPRPEPTVHKPSQISHSQDEKTEDFSIRPMTEAEWKDVKENRVEKEPELYAE